MHPPCIFVSTLITHGKSALFTVTVCIQGYPIELLPVTVAGVPSMHICLDFAPELLSQPSLEKQVSTVVVFVVIYVVVVVVTNKNPISIIESLSLIKISFIVSPLDTIALNSSSVNGSAMQCKDGLKSFSLLSCAYGGIDYLYIISK